MLVRTAGYDYNKRRAVYNSSIIAMPVPAVNMKAGLMKQIFFDFIALCLVFGLLGLAGCQPGQEPESGAEQSGPEMFKVSSPYCNYPFPIEPSSTFCFHVEVTNTSSVAGVYEAVIEVYQVFGNDKIEVTTLKEDIEIPPGSSREVVFEQMHLSEGTYEASIGDRGVRFEVT